jgi:toxin-antitoxin system PIN domain toxin
VSLLDVNALVALAWDSHVHHVAARAWFDENATTGWSTCPITEAGFVRVSSNPKALPSAISVSSAREVLAAMCSVGRHTFVGDDVSIRDADFPVLSSHRQVTDAHLLTLARRRALPLVTFDEGLAALASDAPATVELLLTLA